jgi:hypothetical protein
MKTASCAFLNAIRVFRTDHDYEALIAFWHEIMKKQQGAA